MNFRLIPYLATFTALGVCGQTVPPAAPAPAVPAQRAVPVVPSQRPAAPAYPGGNLLPTEMQQRAEQARQRNAATGNAPTPAPGASDPRTGRTTSFTNSTPPGVPRYGSDTNQAGGPTEQKGTNDFDADDRAGSNTNTAGGGYTNAFGTFTNQLGQSGDTNNPWGPSRHVIPDQGATPQDQALLRQIRRALLPEIRRDHIPIHLVSQNGVVTITGLVPTTEEGQEIADMVQRTPGVVQVQNQLQVAQNTAQFTGDQGFTDHDRDLAGHVRGELNRRHWANNAAESVHIVSRDGVVTLYGFVSSDAEKQQLEAAVQTTPGVVRVDDRLRIRGIADNDGFGIAGQLGTNQTGSASSPGGTAVGTGAYAPVQTSQPPVAGSSTNTAGTQSTNNAAAPR